MIYLMFHCVIIGWVRHVARMSARRNVYNILVGKPEGNRPLGRPRRKWEDNIKMDLRQIVWGGMDWIRLVHGRDKRRALVYAAMILLVL
jgi:hypothetical protein